MTTVYDFSATSLSGEEIPLKKFEGKVQLIVNTASKCGFTPQYSGLEELYKKYAARGFEVLAFPCNQFGGQEPGDAEEIKISARSPTMLLFRCSARLMSMARTPIHSSGF